MLDSERKYLYQEIDKFNLELPLIANLYCVDYDKIYGKVSFISILYDEVLCKKMLIKNEYGLLGNLLYKYRDKLDTNILLYLLEKDIKNFELDEYYNYDLDEIKLNLEYCKEPFICLNITYYLDSFEDLVKNRRIMLEVLRQGKNLFKCIAFHYNDDKEMVMEAVRLCGLFLQYASEELKNDREVVLNAVANDGCALEYASEELKSDKTLILSIVQKDGLLLKYASDKLKNDKEVVLEAIKQNGEAILYNLIKDDIEIEIEAIKLNGFNLQYVGENLRKNKEIVMMAVSNNGCSLEYASDELKSDREVVLKAVTNDGCALEYVNKILLKDKEIVSKAILSNGYAIKFVFDEYIDDIDFLWNLLISNEVNAFYHLSNYQYCKLKEKIKEKYGIMDDRYLKLNRMEEINGMFS